MAERFIRRYRFILAGIAVVCVIGAIIVYAAKRQKDRIPTVYHHEDGTFSLNQKDGPPLKLSAIRDYFESFEHPRGLRLVANPQTKLMDWNPIIGEAAEAGLANYQLEVGKKKFPYHIAVSMQEKEYTKSPEIIRLESSTASTDDKHYQYQVFIVVNDHTKCADVINLAVQKADMGLSVYVFSEMTGMLHNPEMDFELRPPTPHPTFFNGLPQTLIPYLK